MGSPPNSALLPARDAKLADLSADPAIVVQFEQLHYLALAVCPACLIQQRGDEGLIYVPPERQHAKRDKNLLTMWAQASGVRMRIMPEPEEMYDPGDRAAYLTRLLRLHDELIGRGS